MYFYHGLNRVKGKKWETVIVIGMESATLGAIERIFNEMGLKCDTVRPENAITKQKNWMGYSDDCIAFALDQDSGDSLYFSNVMRDFARTSLDIRLIYNDMGEAIPTKLLEMLEES